MEQQQLPRKVKLKTIQPEIMCSGRDFVECYYRGKIVGEMDSLLLIQFKFKGKLINRVYETRGNWGFSHSDLKDIKIVE